MRVIPVRVGSVVGEPGLEGRERQPIEYGGGRELHSPVVRQLSPQSRRLCRLLSEDEDRTPHRPCFLFPWARSRSAPRDRGK